MSVETKHVKIVVGEARLSYTQNVFKPRASESGGQPKYSVVAIIPKTNTVLLEKIKAGIKEAAQKGIDILGGKIPVNLKSPLRDGDNDPEFGTRMRGTGLFAELIGKRFALAVKRLGLDDHRSAPLDTSRFRPPRADNAQGELF